MCRILGEAEKRQEVCFYSFYSMYLFSAHNILRNIPRVEMKYANECIIQATTQMIQYLSWDQLPSHLWDSEGNHRVREKNHAKSSSRHRFTTHILYWGSNIGIRFGHFSKRQIKPILLKLLFLQISFFCWLL